QNRVFPRQLFRRFVTAQLLLVVPAVVVTALAARWYVLSAVDAPFPLEPVLDRVLLGSGFTLAFVFLLISLWIGYRLVLPMGQVLLKAQAILRRESHDEAAVDPDAGEWRDLESALNRIEQNIQVQDRSLSQERGEIEAIISAISDAVVAVDLKGELTFLNSQFAVLFGQFARIEGEGHHISEYIRNPEVIDGFHRVLRDGTPEVIHTLIALRHDRANRHFKLSVAPIRGTGGALGGAVGVFHDVDELKRMEQLRIDFVANVSHELRTPLTSIKGYTQTLREEMAGSPAAGKFVDAISRNVDRLIDLVRDLLNLSHLESGMDIHKTVVDLAELTHRVVAGFEQRRAEKNQNIVVRIQATHLYADGPRIEQIILNLLDNALKYVPAGKTIEIHWTETAEGVELHVLDDGPGIPEEHYPRLFERFYRVDSSRTRSAQDSGGTGLGLAIVKHIVQRHGGKVRAAARDGGGTEFVCSFPKSSP
ncbi:MAG: PAS domain-containing protein, partial [Bdellovibrionales bacterium]|nr:PAS domain-containing protein [Bdellovibrionales bacterium]